MVRLFVRGAFPAAECSCKVLAWRVLRQVWRAAGASKLGAGKSGGKLRQPNIVFITADDIGYADLSCTGAQGYRTPVPDGLAQQGMLLDQTYANAPICSLTRARLLTGRYQGRFVAGLAEPNTIFRPVQELPLGTPTVASLLRDAGYRTALVGKWHVCKIPEYAPTKYGYDHFFGITGGAALNRKCSLASGTRWSPAAMRQSVARSPCTSAQAPNLWLAAKPSSMPASACSPAITGPCSCSGATLATRSILPACSPRSPSIRVVCGTRSMQTLAVSWVCSSRQTSDCKRGFTRWWSPSSMLLDYPNGAMARNCAGGTVSIARESRIGMRRFASSQADPRRSDTKRQEENHDDPLDWSAVACETEEDNPAPLPDWPVP